MKVKEKKEKSASVKLTGPDRLLAIGNQGTALCLSAPPEGAPVDGSPVVVQYRSVKAMGVSFLEIGTLHGKGEASGFAEWDSCAFVAERGTPTQFLPLSLAISKGLVHAVSVVMSRDGVRKSGTVYAPKGWTAGMRQLRVMATADYPAGRIEHGVCPDKRNASYAGSVLPPQLGTKAPSLPVKPADKAPAVKPADKGTKAPSKAPSVPAVKPTAPTKAPTVKPKK